MRKGNEKRQEILAAAGKLFGAKGYDETSVQDILDALGTSKGSFYHHFESKDAVLETLCRERAERARDAAAAEAALKADPLERLGVWLRACLPLRREEASFLALALPLLLRPEGRSLRACYQETLLEVFGPPLDEAVARAAAAGEAFPPQETGVSAAVISLTNRCWLDAARAMLDHARNAGQPESAQLLEQLSLYRCAIERILDVPYGSIELVRLSEWEELAGSVTRSMTLPLNR